MMYLFSSSESYRFQQNMSISPYQKDIVYECLARGSGGLSLPMGTGKTIISLIVGLNQTDSRILVVVSKTLIASWVAEIHKFYRNTIQYEIYHTEYNKNMIDWVPHANTRIILTTPEVVSKAYKDYEVTGLAIENEHIQGTIVIKHYLKPDRPFLTHPIGPGLLFSMEWGTMIVDEIQNYTNISTLKCMSLAAICAKHRWGLSGTLFPEPKVEKILGYYIILNLEGPRTLPEMRELIKSKDFKGLNPTMIIRETNPTFIIPIINEEVVTHNLSKEEDKIYVMMKKIMKALNNKVKEFKLVNDVENTRRFASYCLALLTYLRQSLVCPLIPIASCAVDIAGFEKKSELSKILMDNLEELNLTEWLNNTESICSTRIQSILKKIEEHKDERILLFSSYKSCIDIIKCYLGHYNLYVLEATMSISKRDQMVKDFSQSRNGILCLSYQLGSVGLNLQAASTVMIVDFSWNCDTTKQSIARILRTGQQASKINIIMFVSNTGIEKAIFKKQKDKISVFEDLKTGATDKKVNNIKMDEILKIIELDDNEQLLHQLYDLKLDK